MKKLVVLSGAGISAESGIKTFRDSDGLWEGHDITEVATPEGFARNPQLVLDFYNLRRKQLQEVQPNTAHHILKKLEENFDVVIITQNVDDLHERSGSSKVIHLHGELLKAKSSENESYEVEWSSDITLQHTCPDNHQMRPAIVWFGEAVPKIENAIAELKNADYVLVIGTSLQVYPAAGLIDYAPDHATKFYIDKNPSKEAAYFKNLSVIAKSASEGLRILYPILLSEKDDTN